jgi:hypothetical protein
MDPMEPLPDLASLSDEALKHLIEELERDESDVSYRRRLLQGRIDILRAERTARFRKSVEAGESPLTDVDTLTDILSQKGAPAATEPGE